MFQESCVQPEFIILYLEGGAEFQQKIAKILLCISLEGDPGLSPILHHFFLDCFSFDSALPPIPS